MSDKLTDLIEGVVSGITSGTKSSSTPGNSNVPGEGPTPASKAPKAKAGVNPMPPVATDLEVKNRDAKKAANLTKKAKQPQDAEKTGDRTAPSQGSSKVRVKEEEYTDDMPIEMDDDLDANLSENEDEDDMDTLDEFEIPTTKVGMAKLIFELVRSMDKDELDEKYGDILAAIINEEDSDDDIEIDEESEELVREARARLTVDDIDVSADIEALMSTDDSLTEEFKKAATTLYEAAIVSRVNDEIDRLEEDFKAEIAEARESYEASLAEKVDGYLTYVVSEWMKDNELAIERGLRTEITEEFISSLKQLFDKHYVDIPDEKIDVVEALSAEVEELRVELNNAIEVSIDLHKQLGESVREESLLELSDDLTDTEIEKLRNLAEGVEYEDKAQFTEAISLLKESYFPRNHNRADDEDVDNELADSLENLNENISDSMAAYKSAIARTVKKS